MPANASPLEFLPASLCACLLVLKEFDTCAQACADCTECVRSIEALI